jgi:hypothetical protein
VLSIWTGLVLWSINGTFLWETGRRSRRQRPVYASHSTTDPDGAADRIARHYHDLRAQEGHVVIRLAAAGLP